MPRSATLRREGRVRSAPVVGPMSLDLVTADLTATINPTRGADLVSMVDRRTGVELLHRTPWADRAADVAVSGSRLSLSGAAAWMEGHPGGVQLLCPEPGASTGIEGYRGFHGEASLVPWQVVDHQATAAVLTVDLFTVPLRITRRVTVAGVTLVITDTLTNLAPVEVAPEVQYHVAFGAPLIGPASRLEVAAGQIVIADGPTGTGLTPGSHPWPPQVVGTGLTLDRVPERGRGWSVLGWFDQRSASRARIVNPGLDLAVELGWDHHEQPYLWLWEELGHSLEFPWFGRGWAVALEPSSTVPSPADGEAVPPRRLAAGTTRTTMISLTVGPGGPVQEPHHTTRAH